ncbi:MAG: dehydratase [Chloroflexi bacterium]|nr:dehydratase [Chloroflexota bacterium]
MTTTVPAVRGLYFEEFEVGQKMISPGRTVTESDVVGFAGLSGDFNQIHTDAAYAENSPFGARVAHGLLGLSIASGLALRTGVLEGTVMAFREINSWKFVKPVYLGDTIHVVMEIVTTKAMKRLGGGKVELNFDVKNQKDETVMKGLWSVLVMGKPE